MRCEREYRSRCLQCGHCTGTQDKIPVAMLHGTEQLKSLQGSRKPALPSIKGSLDARTLHHLYNDILKPLTLFPNHGKYARPDLKGPNDCQKYPDSNKEKEVVDSICKDEVYAHAVAPFMKDICTFSSDVLCDVIKRRLHQNLQLNLEAPDVKQAFEEIILSEVKLACEHIPDVLCTSILASREKQHLHRRLLSHIMIVSEQLLLHYLHTMEQSKLHSLFSEQANLTRRKAQLLLDCSKFFNVFSASHYLISEIKEFKGKELLHIKPDNVSADHTVQYSQHPGKRAAARKISTTHFTMEYFIKLGRPNRDVQRDTHLMQIKNIQALDVEKVLTLIPRQDDYSKFMTNVHYEAVTTPCSFKHDGDQEIEEENVYTKCTPMMKKSMSCPSLRMGDLLADELRITFKPYAAECPEIVSTSETEELKENPISKDLRRLIQDSTQHISQHVERPCSDEEIPPLIRALGPGHPSAAKQQKMKALCQDLNKKSEEPREKQKTESVFHPQSFTVDVQIPNRPLLRRMDAQASDRIFTHTTEIQKYPPIYNDFASEIEADTVKRLDSNLYVGQELEDVYTELVKNLSNNHLRFDQDFEFEPYATKLDFSACAASSTLTRKSNQRVINKELDSLAVIECESVAQHPTIDKEATRHCNSWLVWWKSVVNTDDYMKYISTQDVDYLKVIYHLYNSESEDEEQARITLLKKREEQKRQREKRIADIRAEKQSYKPGMWNVNSVLLGGLGSDPPIHDVEWEVKEQLEDSSEGDVAVNHADLQKKINTIWNALHVPEDQRLDMAIKYSSEEYSDQLPQAIQVWQKVVKFIQRREKMLAELERFEKDASDPNRFFHRGYSGTSLARMEESKQRKELHKHLADIEHCITKALQVIKKTFNDEVRYKGRPYAEKMKWDKTEMLYWLQQQRRKTLIEMDIEKKNALINLDLLS